MKKILGLLCFATIINFIPLVAQAQNECFMLDANGKPMDLRHLCGGANTNTNTNISTPVRTTRRQKAGVFIIPIKRREAGVPIVDVKFNDKYTFEMMLDTGASFTVLTPKMAQILKIKLDGVMLAETASDKVAFSTGKVASAAVGDAVSNNLLIAVAPTLSIGLLGQNFYSHYDVTIKQDVVEFRVR